MSLQFKRFAGEVKAFDDKTLTIEHFISTEKQDSVGDIMLAEGMILRGHPVVLFQHGQDAKYGNEPIAKVISITVGTNKEGIKGLIAKTQYFDATGFDENDKTGQRLYEKAKTGVMPNWSIGFNSVKEKPTPGGRIVTEWELFEYSQVAVACNDSCTTLSGDIPEVKFLIVTPKALPEVGGHRIELKAMRILHKAAMEELKTQASSEGFDPEADTEKCAGEVISDFVGAATGHAEKMLKSLSEAEENQGITIIDGDTVYEEEEKALVDTKATIARAALKTAFKMFISDMVGFKGMKTIDVAHTAKEQLSDLSEASGPHAKEYMKAIAAKCSSGKTTTEQKSISQKIAYEKAFVNMKIIHKGMIDETFSKAYSEEHKDMEPETLAADITSEAGLLHHEHVKAIISAVRKQTQGQDVLVAKGIVEKMKANIQVQEDIAAVPAPATTTPVEPKIKFHQPAVKRVRFTPVPVESAVRMKFKPAPVVPGLVKFSKSDIQKLIDSALIGQQKAIQEEIERASGKVTN